jgi:uncharacterized protein YbjQ (UPF0145 family)
MFNYDEDSPFTDINFIILMLFFFAHVTFLYSGYKASTFYTEEDPICVESDTKPKSETEIVKEEIKQPQIPYEEKYLIKVRGMKNEYVFTEEELQLKEKKLQELEEEEKNQKLESIYSLNEKIEELTMKLAEITPHDDEDTSKNSKKDTSIMKKLHDSIQNEINLYEKKLLELQENSTNMDELQEKAQQYIIDEQLKTFKKKYVIEHTPLGNVLLFYNHDKSAFEYYSDLTIPYRYLETVARKYVLLYNYRPLYIDMEEELKEYERKLDEKEKAAKEKLEIEKLKTNAISNTKPKDVFAKFKSYNKEAGTGRVNTAPPPKNSIPQSRLINTNLNNNKNNDKILLKENANRYSYQGKFVNFNILQKIDKKVIDKKYALTFADFKKMNKQNLENKN